MLTKAVPQITICLNGVVQPAVLSKYEHLTIRLPSSTAPPAISSTKHTEISEEHKNSDLLDEVDQFLNDNDTADQEDAPNWEFEEGEFKSKDPNYVFFLHPIKNHYSTFSLNTSVSIPFSPSIIQNVSQHLKSDTMLLQRCISSVISRDSVKCGDTCGPRGTS